MTSLHGSRLMRDVPPGRIATDINPDVTCSFHDAVAITWAIYAFKRAGHHGNVSVNANVVFCNYVWLMTSVCVPYQIQEFSLGPNGSRAFDVDIIVVRNDVQRLNIGIDDRLCPRRFDRFDDRTASHAGITDIRLTERTPWR
jgi:hypothetical protein